MRFFFDGVLRDAPLYIGVHKVIYCLPHWRSQGNLLPPTWYARSTSGLWPMPPSIPCTHKRTSTPDVCSDKAVHCLACAVPAAILSLSLIPLIAVPAAILSCGHLFTRASTHCPHLCLAACLCAPKTCGSFHHARAAARRLARRRRGREVVLELVCGGDVDTAALWQRHRGPRHLRRKVHASMPQRQSCINAAASIMHQCRRINHQ